MMSLRCERAMQYGEFRRGFRLDGGGHDVADTRLVFYGMRYIVESYLMRRWTRADVEAAAQFYRRARVRAAQRACAYCARRVRSRARMRALQWARSR